MLVIRPIATSDYPALHDCAIESGHGFTSLPVNQELLTNRIEHSEYSFAKPSVTQPWDEGYLMVGVDSVTGEVAGTTGIEAAVGWDRPFILIILVRLSMPHISLGSTMSLNYSPLVTTTPDAQRFAAYFARALSPRFEWPLNVKESFLMMAEHPERFSKTIFAEMRGVSDADGNSPFGSGCKSTSFQSTLPWLTI